MDEIINSLSSSLAPNPKAAIIEASTKLTLDWADQQRPLNANQITETLHLLITSFKQGLGSELLDKQAQVAVVKSASRLSAYWYSQNKSASLKDIAEVIKQFEKTAAQDLL